MKLSHFMKLLPVVFSKDKDNFRIRGEYVPFNADPSIAIADLEFLRNGNGTYHGIMPWPQLRYWDLRDREGQVTKFVFKYVGNNSHPLVGVSNSQMFDTSGSVEGVFYNMHLRSAEEGLVSFFGTQITSGDEITMWTRFVEAGNPQRMEVRISFAHNEISLGVGFKIPEQYLPVYNPTILFDGPARVVVVEGDRDRVRKRDAVRLSATGLWTVEHTTGEHTAAELALMDMEVEHSRHPNMEFKIRFKDGSHYILELAPCPKRQLEEDPEKKPESTAMKRRCPPSWKAPDSELREVKFSNSSTRLNLLLFSSIGIMVFDTTEDKITLFEEGNPYIVWKRENPGSRPLRPFKGNPFQTWIERHPDRAAALSNAVRNSEDDDYKDRPIVSCELYWKQ